MWKELNINHELMYKELNKSITNLVIDFELFTEFSLIKEWIEFIHNWKHINLNYKKDDTTLMGAYGELAAALILCQKSEFMEWVPTMAVDICSGRRRSNKNNDIKCQWTWINGLKGSIEVKTATNKTVSVSKILPDYLFVVKALETYKYEYFSIIDTNMNIPWKPSKLNDSQVWAFLDEIPHFRTAPQGAFHKKQYT